MYCIKSLIMVGIFAALTSTGLYLNRGDEPGKRQSSSEKIQKIKRMPFRGKIMVINREAKTFTLPGKKKVRVFRVTTKTKFVKHGKAAKFSDAVVGEMVGGVAVAGAAKIKEVLSLRIGPKPKPTTPKKKNPNKNSAKDQ